MNGEWRKAVGVRFALTAFIVVAALCILAPISQAQNTGTITGTVYDKSGAVVPGASVSLINEESADVRSTVSNSDGVFAFGTVPPGTFSVKIEAKGFKTWESKGLALQATDKRSVIATLDVGQSSETVTVEAHTDITPVDSGARSLNLTAVDYNRLPMITRNAAELLRTLPGVITIGNGVTNGANSSMDFSGVGAAGSSVGNGVSAGGVPYRGGTQLEMDGTNILDEGCDCTSIAVPDPDFVQEVKVQTSAFTADSTKGPVVINFLTKSGGAQWHGSGYLYVRNAILNSNTWQNDHAGIPKATGDHYYYPGGTIGGPVPAFKKKLLIWGGYEHFYQLASGGTTLTSFIPTADMLAGNYGQTAANNAICQAMLGVNADDSLDAKAQGTFCAAIGQNGAHTPAPNTVVGTSFNGSFLPGGIPIAVGTTSFTPDPGAQLLMGLMPTANIDPAVAPGNANYYYPVPALHNGYVYRLRGDYSFNENNKLYATWQYANDNQPSNGDAHMWWLPGNSVVFPGGGLSNATTTKNTTASFLHVFNPTLTNELVGYWTFYWSPQIPNNPSALLRGAVGYTGPDITHDPASTAYGTVFAKQAPLANIMVPGWNQPGNFNFPDFSQWDVFSNTGGVYYIKKQNPAFGDNLTKVIKTHTFKTGIYYEMTGNNQGNFNPYNGGFSFGNNSNPDAVTGLYQGTANPTANFMMGVASNYNETNYLPLNDQAYKTYAAYFMDSWKATRRLTVDIGFRFEHMDHWYDRAGFGNAVWLPGRVASDVVAGKTDPGVYWHAIDPGIPLQGAPVRFAFAEPRLGMAFDVFGTGKTTIRGGWGMYRFNDQVNDYGGPLGLAQQMLTSTLLNNQTILFSETQLAQQPLTTFQYPNPGVNVLDPKDYEVPFTNNWNFTIDQRTPWHTLLEVAYEGSHGGSLLLGGQTGGGGTLGGGDLINVNKTPLGAYFQPDPVTGNMVVDPENISSDCGTHLVLGVPVRNQPTCQADFRPYGTTYGTNAINVESHKAYSNYNALAVIWTKQTGHLTFNTSFLWSKSLGFGFNSGYNPFNMAADYVVLNIDRPYVWNSTYAYEFGKAYKGGNKFISGAVNNWTISGFTTWQKGANLQAQTSQNLGLGLRWVNEDLSTSGLSQRTFYGTDANMNIQPIETCNPTTGLASNQYANLACFAPPGIPTGTAPTTPVAQGTMQFPYIGMQNYFSSDLAIFKMFHITERHKVEFRIAATNWMNHPLWGFANNQPVTLQYTIPRTNPSAGYTYSGATAASAWGISNTKYEPLSQAAGRTLQLGLKYNF
jgi:Carboxypeptidase regulatory-like domain